MAGETQTIGQIVESSIEIKSFFPTPLIKVMLSGHEAINADLAARVRERASTHASVAKSNLGGWQSDTDFEQWCGPAGLAVLEAARRLGNVVTAVTEADGLKRTEVPWRVNVWANLNGPGNVNEMHTHAGAFWSGAYYVDTGEVPGEAAGGEFEILDPRGVTPIMYAPHLKIAVSGCLTAGLSEHLKPLPGQLFLFPSWLYHGVRPYLGTRTRISIAFNLCL